MSSMLPLFVGLPVWMTVNLYVFAESETMISASLVVFSVFSSILKNRELYPAEIESVVLIHSASVDIEKYEVE